MKLKLVALIFLTAGLSGTFAQDSTRVDTAVVDSVKKKNRSFDWSKVKNDTTCKKTSSKFSFQLTFSRIDLGLATFLDKGSFTLSPEYDFLENKRWKTNNFGFEFFQTGYRFNSYFKIYLGAGIDWNHIRLTRDINILPEKPVLTYEDAGQKFEKNRFSSTYLRIPLSFQLRTRDDQKGNKYYFVAGPEVGFLINGKTKQVSDDKGKVKFKDDFNFNPFRYGAFARLGYDALGIYVKYYANDVFADNQAPADFKNLNFGLMLGF